MPEFSVYDRMGPQTPVGAALAGSAKGGGDYLGYQMSPVNANYYLAPGMAKGPGTNTPDYQWTAMLANMFLHPGVARGLGSESGAARGPSPVYNALVGQ